MITARQAKEIIEREGLKQTVLAKRIGISQPMLNRWINGHSEMAKHKVEALHEILKIHLHI